MNHQQRRVHKALVRKEMRELADMGVSQDVLDVMFDLSVIQAKTEKPIVEGEKCQKAKDHSSLNLLIEKQEEVVLKIE